MSLEGHPERLNGFNRDEAVESIINGLQYMTDVQIKGLLQQIKAREGVVDNG